MSDYHNRIMNIATEPGIEELERGDRLLYKYGHQVARHAAAEIAAEAEEEITCLQADNEALRAKADLFRRACEDVLDGRPLEQAFILRKQAEAVEEAAADKLYEVAFDIEYALQSGYSGSEILDENSPIRIALVEALKKADGDTTHPTDSGQGGSQ